PYQEHEKSARRHCTIHNGPNGPELRSGLIGIQFTQRAENARAQNRGRKTATDNELRAIWPLLRDWVVDLGARPALDIFLMHIVHDADDAILLLAPQEDFANGILIGPVNSGGGGIDQDNSLAMGAVVPGELAPVESDAHGADESRRDDIDQRVGQFVGSKGFSLWHGRIPFAVGSQRKVVGHACGLDAWKRAH